MDDGIQFGKQQQMVFSATLSSALGSMMGAPWKCPGISFLCTTPVRFPSKHEGIFFWLFCPERLKGPGSNSGQMLLTGLKAFFKSEDRQGAYRSQRLAIIQTACTMPGIYPRSVKRMFSQKAPLNPT
jgi:hypothetical protein